MRPDHKRESSGPPFIIKKSIYHYRMKPFPFLLIILFIHGSQVIRSQGCSDAGLCSIKPFRPQAQLPATPFNNQLSVGLNAGAGDLSVFAFGTSLGYSRQINQSWSLDSKITYHLRTGNDISVNGPGDVFVNINYKPSIKWTLTAGIKIPLNDGNLDTEEVGFLPMDYQTSLGTLDLIAGLGLQLSSWQIVLAYQQPLTQNENQFVAEDHDPSSALRNFPSTAGFQRKADLLARISYPLFLSDKFTMTPGIMPVYHLGEDEYRDDSGRQQPFIGSDGLTINASVFFDILLSEKSKLGMHVGFPLLVRDARPDGLTRGFVAGIEYGLFF